MSYIKERKGDFVLIHAKITSNSTGLGEYSAQRKEDT